MVSPYEVERLLLVKAAEAGPVFIKRVAFALTVIITRPGPVPTLQKHTITLLFFNGANLFESLTLFQISRETSTQ